MPIYASPLLSDTLKFAMINDFGACEASEFTLPRSLSSYNNTNLNEGLYQVLQ